ncbi:MAG: acyl transferase, partial [Salegentibacter sp.]
MLSEKIFEITGTEQFLEVTLQVFRFQYKNNHIYRKFCDLLGRNPGNVEELTKIPFLPIEFFKTNSILSSEEPVQITFTSSGTTGSTTSRHLVTDLSLYERSFQKAFENFYGQTGDLVILALLPSYLERQGSSLIYMAEALIKKSEQPESGFYLHNLEELQQKLTALDKAGKKILLIGVSFA